MLFISSQMANIASFSTFFSFCVSVIYSQIFPYFLMLSPAILVNSFVNKRSVPTSLGFCYSIPLCLCVIKLYMGVNIQRYVDVRIPRYTTVPRIDAAHQITLWVQIICISPSENQPLFRAVFFTSSGLSEYATTAKLSIALVHAT